MDTIKTYVFNVFSTFPKNEKIEKLKNDILTNMEDKYNQLKSEGKSENEAIGIVISEFGNIEELIKELDIDMSNEKEDDIPTLDNKYVDEYLSIKRKSTFLVSIGVMLIMFGASILILLTQLIEDNIIFKSIANDPAEVISLVPLLLLVAIAVGIFIYSGTKIENYKFIEEGNFKLTFSCKEYIQKKYEDNKIKSTMGVVVGVIICILSPLTVILGSIISDSASVYGTSILLVLISIAVFLFINFGTTNTVYKILLKIQEFTPKKREDNKVISAVASVVWPITAAVYVLLGFTRNGWGKAWVIFPIVGILFGAFSSCYSAIKKTK